MFSRNKPKSGAAEIAAPPSIVSSDLHITGNLRSKGDIQIDGIVDGDIKSKKLTIGLGATVNGAINCESVRIAGDVNGEIHAGTVELIKSAKVIGDIHHETLSIEAGALVDGMCRHVNKMPDVSLVRPSLVVSDGSSAPGVGGGT